MKGKGEKEEKEVEKEKSEAKVVGEKEETRGEEKEASLSNGDALLVASMKGGEKISEPETDDQGNYGGT